MKREFPNTNIEMELTFLHMTIQNMRWNLLSFMWPFMYTQKEWCNYQ